MPGTGPGSEEQLSSPEEASGPGARLLSDLDLAGMLSVGREELEEVDRVSNLISGAQCDFIEELRRSAPCSPRQATGGTELEPPLGLQEEELDCQLGQFNFNLAGPEGGGAAREAREMERLESDLQRITEQLTSSSSSLWEECFPGGMESPTSSASSEYDDLLDSILSSPDHSLDPDYFNSDNFDIDSVDPTCLHEDRTEASQDELEDITIKQEVMEEGEEEREEEEEEVHPSRLDHDYSLPPSSSVLITPPPTSEDESEPGSPRPPPARRYNRSLLHRPHLVRTHGPHRGADSTTQQQVIKFQHKKDLKFVMSIQVKNEELKATSPRSLLKSKLLGRAGRRVKDLQREEERRCGLEPQHTKTAKELVREIIEKRHRVEDLKSRREQVKGMKRALRLDGRAEAHRAARQARQADLCTRPDLRKYRKFEEERELHNSMERQRRVELKDAYDGLKDRIPGIAAEEKVSKLMILNTAADYCRGAEARLDRLRRERGREEDRSRRLQERLALLHLPVL